MLENTKEVYTVKGLARILMVLMLLVTPALFSNTALAGIFDGECDDTVYDPGTRHDLVYHTNQYKFLKGCVRQSDDRTDTLPLHAGKDCASPRIDGCSLHESKYIFTERDQKLMKAACNEHDLCYSTYGTSKIECDGNFAGNLIHLRSAHQGGYTVEAVVGAVLMLGDHEAGQTWGKDNGCKR